MQTQKRIALLRLLIRNGKNCGELHGALFCPVCCLSPACAGFDAPRRNSGVLSSVRPVVFCRAGGVLSRLGRTFSFPAGAAALIGCLIPAFASLWVDIRVRSVRVRRVLLVLGLLGLCYYLLWMTGILNLWPDAFAQCYPLRLWFATLSTVGNELLRLGPLFLSGGLLFLVLNR